MFDTTEQEMLQYIIDQSLLETRTVVLGICVSFNEPRETVTVQPALMRRVNGETKLAQQVQDIPIKYYGAGGVGITFKPKVGDICELHVVDRSIEAWKKEGGIIDPAKKRHHNLNDATAYFGLNDYKNVYGNLRDGLDMRTRDGVTHILVEQGKITVEHGDTATVTTSNSVDVTMSGNSIMTLTPAAATFTVPIEAPEGQFTNSLKVKGIEQADHDHAQGTYKDSGGGQVTGRSEKVGQ